MPAPNRDTIQSSINSYTYTGVLWNGSSTSGGNANLGSTRSFRDYYSVSSVKTPNYRRLKAWQLPKNNYAKNTILFRDSLGFYQQRHVIPGASNPAGTYIENYVCNCNFLGIQVQGIAPWSGAEADDPSQKAISNLISGITEQRASTGVMLAEANKTAAHVAHTATRIFGALRALKSARFGTFLNAIGLTATSKQTKTFYTGLKNNFGVPNQGFRFDKKFPLTRMQQKTQFTDFCSRTWLEYSYGWKPLLRDVYEHAEALASAGINYSGALRVGVGRSKADKTTRVTEKPNSQIWNVRLYKSSKWVEYKVWYKIPDGVLDYANVFGLNNPLAIAWELVPFSFVADWFLPIGRALECITAYNGLVFHSGYKSVRHVWSHQARPVAGLTPYVLSGQSYYFLGSNCKATYVELGISRQNISSFPQFGFPKWKDPRSFAHAASAVALLQTIFLSSK